MGGCATCGTKCMEMWVLTGSQTSRSAFRNFGSLLHAGLSRLIGHHLGGWRQLGKLCCAGGNVAQRPDLDTVCVLQSVAAISILICVSHNCHVPAMEAAAATFVPCNMVCLFLALGMLQQCMQLGHCYVYVIHTVLWQPCIGNAAVSGRLLVLQRAQPSGMVGSLRECDSVFGSPRAMQWSGPWVLRGCIACFGNACVGAMVVSPVDRVRLAGASKEALLTF
jgi:hypothetical protein